MRKTRIAAVGAGIAATALLLAGCSAPAPEAETGATPAAELIPVSFQLNWVAGGAIAGYAVAAADGLYEELGLDVTLVEGNGSGNVAQLVANNQAQVAVADATSVAQLIAKGAAMRTVATLYQSSPYAVQSLTTTGIDSIEDLAGHSIAVPAGAPHALLLKPMLEEAGLQESDVQLVNMPGPSMVAALMQGQVDAILGAVDSYKIQLDEQGAKVDQYLFVDSGVPTVSIGIFASDRFIVDNPEVVEKIVAASLQGWSVALDDPEHAVEAVTSVFPDANAKTVAAELEAMSPLLCANDAKFVGKAEPEAWKRTQDILASVGLLPEGQDPTAYYSYNYLPDEADLRSCDADTE